jgi:hypothetical protein
MGLVEVLGAYLLGKTFAGIAISILAFKLMNQASGRGWWRTPLAGMAEWRSILGFAVNTNLNGTVNLITRDNAPLYLAALSPASLAQTYVGYFKLGLSIINFITLPIDPFIWPTYAEITLTIALRQWQKTQPAQAGQYHCRCLTLAAGADCTVRLVVDTPRVWSRCSTGLPRGFDPAGWLRGCQRAQLEPPPAARPWKALLSAACGNRTGHG